MCVRVVYGDRCASECAVRFSFAGSRAAIILYCVFGGIVSACANSKVLVRGDFLISVRRHFSHLTDRCWLVANDD